MKDRLIQSRQPREYMYRIREGVMGLPSKLQGDKAKYVLLPLYFKIASHTIAWWQQEENEKSKGHKAERYQDRVSFVN